jgi:hypothetical protein
LVWLRVWACEMEVGMGHPGGSKIKEQL